MRIVWLPFTLQEKFVKCSWSKYSETKDVNLEIETMDAMMSPWSQVWAGSATVWWFEIVLVGQSVGLD